MRRISRVVIDGLFGYLPHDIRLRVDEPTIFTGPNGVGKTNVLMLIRAALNLDIKGLIELPFKQLNILFDDKRSLSIVRAAHGDIPVRISIIAKRGDRRLGAAFESDEEDLGDLVDIPPWVERMSDDRWYDGRSGSVISGRLLERRYNLKLSKLSRDRFEAYPEILATVSGLEPILIDTKRLDALVGESPSRIYSGEAPSRPQTTRIQQYIHQIRAQVEEARRASVVATQSADLSFASRALAAAHARVNEAALHKRYDMIVEQYEDLSQNGLAVGEAPLEFPENTTPTIRRILNVFLDDWEKRLEPLRPVNSKLNLLRRILDGKLAVTGKTTRMTERGLLQFVDPQAKLIRVAKLSSGEQHLVALFAMLLFSAKPASIVLIDEPEISLHAAWKHSFLDDISEVARLADLQVVLATHSSGIVNGRWDLTEELAYTPTIPSELAETRSGDQETEDEFE